METEYILFSFLILSAFSKQHFDFNKLGSLLIFPVLYLNIARMSVPGCLCTHICIDWLAISKHRSACLVDYINRGNWSLGWRILWKLCAPLILPKKSWDDVLECDFIAVCCINFIYCIAIEGIINSVRIYWTSAKFTDLCWAVSVSAFRSFTIWLNRLHKHKTILILN